MTSKNKKIVLAEKARGFLSQDAEINNNISSTVEVINFNDVIAEIEARLVINASDKGIELYSFDKDSSIDLVNQVNSLITHLSKFRDTLARGITEYEKLRNDLED